MKAINRNELWAFVWRADTREKIAVAEKWLMRNVKDNDLFDDLMRCLAHQSLSICEDERKKSRKY